MNISSFLEPSHMYQRHTFSDFWVNWRWVKGRVVEREEGLVDCNHVLHSSLLVFWICVYTLGRLLADEILYVLHQRNLHMLSWLQHLWRKFQWCVLARPHNTFSTLLSESVELSELVDLSECLFAYESWTDHDICGKSVCMHVRWGVWCRTSVTCLWQTTPSAYHAKQWWQAKQYQ